MEQARIRPYRSGDEEGIQNVIRSVYEEYGFTWEPDGYNSDTADVETFYILSGGGFWVLEHGSKIIGTVGIKRLSSSRCDLARLYLLKENRGAGLGKRLFVYAQEMARQMGFVEMEIWSDKKLLDAHRLYEKSGAASIGERICDDPDQSHEWGFLMPLCESGSCL